LPTGHKIGNTDNSGGTSWNNLIYDHILRTANLIDCEDPDCNGLQGAGGICQWSHETTCNDGFNNEIMLGGDSFLSAVNGTSSSANVLWTYTGALTSIRSMKIQDLNNDGDEEIVVGDSSGIFYAFNKSGYLLWNYNINLGDFGYAAPTGKSISMDISDMNGDGINDILVGTAEGYVHILQDVNCLASFNDSTSYNMTWNNSLSRWYMNRSFSTAQNYNYNVTCSKGGYVTQTTSDDVGVSAAGAAPNLVQLNAPANGTISSNTFQLLNSTVQDPDNDNMTVYIYASNDSTTLGNKNSSLVYIGTNVANGSDVTYNLTALPINPSSNGLVLLMHFDNLSEFGENDTHVYDFSRNGNNGTCTSCPVWNSSGKIAGGFESDGISNYFNVSDNSSLDILNSGIITVVLIFLSLTLPLFFNVNPIATVSPGLAAS